jgi:hypothetical protein
VTEDVRQTVARATAQRPEFPGTVSKKDLRGWNVGLAGFIGW